MLINVSKSTTRPSASETYAVFPSSIKRVKFYWTHTRLYRFSLLIDILKLTIPPSASPSLSNHQRAYNIISVSSVWSALITTGFAHPSIFLSFDVLLLRLARPSVYALLHPLDIPPLIFAGSVCFKIKSVVSSTAARQHSIESGWSNRCVSDRSVYLAAMVRRVLFLREPEIVGYFFSKKKKKQRGSALLRDNKI